MSGRKIFGLPNMGNTCFINSVIQCLYNCKSIRDEIIIGDTNYGKCFKAEFRENKEEMCSYFARDYNTNSTEYNYGDSHDCQEYLIFLLTKLKTKTNIVKYNKLLYNIEKNEESISMMSDDILCLPMKDNVFDSFTDWLIEKTDTHIHRNVFTEIGNIVIVSMGRFHAEFKDGTMKLTKNQLPITIDMEINFEKNDENYPMNIIGFIVHVGTFNGGHYVSFCKIDNEWYLFDDLSVYKTGKPKIEHAYIIFYEKNEST